MSDEAPVVPWIRDLQSLPRWCRWRLLATESGRATKVPDQSTAQLTECRSWERVKSVKRTGESGVGLVLTAGVHLDNGQRLLCLDLDACIADDGSLPLSVEQLLDRVPGPAETSPSRRGLHVWFVVDEPLPPRLRTRIAAPWSPPPGVDKRPEIQLFGTGPAGYVTVTLQHLAGTPTEFTPVPVSVLLELLGEHAHDTDAEQRLPTGWGPEPTAAEIAEAVRGSPKGARLLLAEWEGLDYESASEAYFGLVTQVLRAANGHGAAAVDFLLQHTAWGRALVPESRDPGKYGRESWIMREVARAATKSSVMQADPTAAFEALETPQSSQLRTANLEELPGVAAPVSGLTPAAVSDGTGHAEPTPPTSPPEESPLAANGSAAAPAPQPRALVSPFRSVADLLAAPRRPDLWSRMMPRASLNVWFGAPKCGKSYLALNLGVAIVEGTPFLGRRVARGRVLYVAGEGVRGVADKVAAAIGPSRAADAQDPFHRAFRVLPAMPRLTDPKTMAAVLGAIEDDGGFDLLIVDTVARAIGASGLDENSTEDMNAFVAALDQLWRSTGAAVLGVHHENKSGGDRGSSVLRGAADVFARVAREGKRSSMFAVQDMRDGEPSDPIEVLWDNVVVGTDDAGDPIHRWRVGGHYDASDPRHGATLKPPEQKILQVLAEAGPGALSRKEIEERSGMTKATVNRHLASLVGKRLTDSTVLQGRPVFRLVGDSESESV